MFELVITIILLSWIFVNLLIYWFKSRLSYDECDKDLNKKKYGKYF